MNYTPNTTHWKRGDVVIHDCDAKVPHMLMRVIGYTRDGLCKTQYIDLDYHKVSPNKIWENEIKYLHDPMRFPKTAAHLAAQNTTP